MHREKIRFVCFSYVILLCFARSKAGFLSPSRLTNSMRYADFIPNLPYFHCFTEHPPHPSFFSAHKFHSTGVVQPKSEKIWLCAWLPLPLAKIINDVRCCNPTRGESGCSSKVMVGTGTLVLSRCEHASPQAYSLRAGFLGIYFFNLCSHRSVVADNGNVHEQFSLFSPQFEQCAFSCFSSPTYSVV